MLYMYYLHGCCSLRWPISNVSCDERCFSRRGALSNVHCFLSVHDLLFFFNFDNGKPNRFHVSDIKLAADPNFHQLLKSTVTLSPLLDSTTITLVGHRGWWVCTADGKCFAYCSTLHYFTTKKKDTFCSK